MQTHERLSDIPIGKVARVGRWNVSRWAADEYDVMPATVSGPIFADGKPIMQSVLGVTADKAAEITGAKP